MSGNDATPTERWPLTTYRLEVYGHVPAMLSEDLAGFTIDPGPTTTLTGPVDDAAALYGLIARLECLGVSLLSVHPDHRPSKQPTVGQPRISDPARSTTMPDTAHDHSEPITISEHSRLLLATHRAMRADAERLITATEHLGDRQPDGARALGRAFAEIVTLIHDHHWTEDDVMYPFLVARLPGFAHDVAQLEGDHIDLDAAMARITAGLRLLARSSTPKIAHDTGRRLVDDARAFNRILVDHLDREEAVVVTPFDSTISAAEQRQLTTAEAKLSTYRHVRMAVPWVLANATDADAAELRRYAPRLIGLIHDHRWERRFQQIMAPLYRTAPASTPSTRSPTASAA